MSQPRRTRRLITLLALIAGALLAIPGAAWAGTYPSTISLTSNPVPGVVGQAWTLTATVSGDGTPTGTVAFSEQVCTGGGDTGEEGGSCTGSETLGTATVRGGVATLTVTPTTAGTHNLYLEYSGDDRFVSTNTSAALQVVDATNGPTITAIRPPNGPGSGGTAVRLVGTNLKNTQTVTVAGTPVPFTATKTRISFTSPAHPAGPVDVVVMTPNGTATTRFTYDSPPKAPSIATIAPARGPAAGGTSVRLTGNDFTGATQVTVDGTPVTFTATKTRITFVTPAHAAGQVTVLVTGPGGTSNAVGFTYR